MRDLLKKYAQRGKIDMFITYEDLTENKVCLKYNGEIAAICGIYFIYLYRKGIRRISNLVVFMRSYRDSRLSVHIFMAD